MLSDQIRKCIATSGLTAYRLAREADVSEATLSRFLRGERAMTTDSLDRIAEVLRLDVTMRGPRAAVRKKPRRK